MANNHEQFIAFNDAITLTDTKKESLTTNRKSNRNIIKKYFDENKPKEIRPSFRSQGSFVMKTAVNPIPRIDSDKNTTLKYDVDDGIYFIGNESEDDRKAITTYHEWIYDAVQDRTNKGAEKRNTCVRVLYADGHHIDLPIYYQRKDIEGSIPQLAHKSKGWIDSDPKEFYEWFNKQASSNPQLRRIVKYLKAWCDNRNFKNSTIKMPSGFIMTILASENISKNDKDDIAFKETVCKIQKKIDPDKGGVFECKRPTTPKGEDLFESFSKTRRTDFLNCLDSLVTSASQAIESKNQKEACLKWQNQFGDRFSCSNAKDEDEPNNPRSYANPAVVPSNMKNA